MGAGTEPLFMDPVAATRKRAADPNRQPAHKFLGRLYAGVPAGTDAQVGAALAELGAGCLRLRARRYWASAQRIPAAAQRGRMSPNRRCGLGPVGGLQFFTLWAWALTISMVDSIGRRAESATDRGLSGM